MKRFIIIVSILLIASTSAGAEAQEMYAEDDREMIALLGLKQDQALAYVRIMEKRREVFLQLQARQWQQELAFYHETFAMLRPVLTRKQLAKFVAVINSVIEDTEDGELVAMGE
jgi:hypothetical protein